MPLTALDYEGILQTLARYVHAVDFGKSKALAETFVETGTYEIQESGPKTPTGGLHEGRAAIVTLGDMLWAGSQGQFRHWTQAPVIEEVSDGHVRLSSYVAVMKIDDPAHISPVLTGIYRDELKKVDGQWLFSSRVFRPDSLELGTAGR